MKHRSLLLAVPGRHLLYVQPRRSARGSPEGGMGHRAPQARPVHRGRLAGVAYLENQRFQSSYLTWSRLHGSNLVSANLRAEMHSVGEIQYRRLRSIG
jgi:hypothetical protein